MDQHHSDPKYLGGASQQKLTDLEPEDHQQIHEELDRLFPRHRGKAYYDARRASDPGFQDQVDRALHELYGRWADKYPSLPADFEENIRNRRRA